MGTVYRRFPTKQALITELVRDMLDAMNAMAQAAVAVPDGHGLEHYLTAASAYQAEHRGCLPRLWNIDEHQPALQKLRKAVATLLADAKRHGLVREEVTSTDITMVMWSIRGVIETTADVAPEAWRRHLDIVVAGLRPADRALRHPPLTRQQTDAVVTRS
jgi:AcrR family transcriptional regulator